MTRTDLVALSAARSWAETLRGGFEQQGAATAVGAADRWARAARTGAREVAKVLPLPVLASLAWDEPAAAVFSHGARRPRRFDRSRCCGRCTAPGRGTGPASAVPTPGSPAADPRPEPTRSSTLATAGSADGMSIDDLHTAGAPDPSDLPLFAPVPSATARAGARRLHDDTHHRTPTGRPPRRPPCGGRAGVAATAAPVRGRPRLGRWWPRSGSRPRTGSRAALGEERAHLTAAEQRDRGPRDHRRAAARRETAERIERRRRHLDARGAGRDGRRGRGRPVPARPAPAAGRRRPGREHHHHRPRQRHCSS